MPAKQIYNFGDFREHFNATHNCEFFSIFLPDDFINIIAVGVEAQAYADNPKVNYLVADLFGRTNSGIAFTYASYWTVFYPFYVFGAILTAAVILVSQLKQRCALRKLGELINSVEGEDYNFARSQVNVLCKEITNNPTFQTMLSSLLLTTIEQSSTIASNIEVNDRQLEEIENKKMDVLLLTHEVDNPLAALDQQVANLETVCDAKILSKVISIRDTIKFTRTMLHYKFKKATGVEQSASHNHVWLRRLIEESLNIAVHANLNNKAEACFENLDLQININVNNPLFRGLEDIWANKSGLQAILMNVFKNSFTHSFGTRLWVDIDINTASDKSGVEVEFTIRDLGIGFSKESLESIGEARNFKGDYSFGIGLGIVKDILKNEFKSTLTLGNDVNIDDEVIGTVIRFKINAIIGAPNVYKSLPEKSFRLITNGNDDRADNELRELVHSHVTHINNRYYKYSGNEKDALYFHVPDGDMALGEDVIIIDFDKEQHTLEVIRDFGRDNPEAIIILLCGAIDLQMIRKEQYLTPYTSDSDGLEDGLILDNIHAIQKPFLLIDLLRMTYRDTDLVKARKTKKSKILIVEDNITHAEGIIQNLPNAIDACLVTSNAQAIETVTVTLNKDRFDLILVDGALVDGASDGFLEYLSHQHEYKNTPVLGCSFGKLNHPRIDQVVQKVNSCKDIADNICDALRLKSSGLFYEGEKQADAHALIQYFESFIAIGDYIGVMFDQDRVFNLKHLTHSFAGKPALNVGLDLSIRQEFLDCENELDKTLTLISTNNCNPIENEDLQKQVSNIVYRIIKNIEQIKPELVIEIFQSCKIEFKKFLTRVKNLLNNSEFFELIEFIDNSAPNALSLVGRFDGEEVRIKIEFSLRKIQKSILQGEFKDAEVEINTIESLVNID